MRRSFCSVLCFAYVLLITRVRSGITFVTPPPMGPRGVYKDNPVYGYGTNVTVRWILDNDTTIPESVKLLDLFYLQDTLSWELPGYYGVSIGISNSASR